MDQRPDEMRQFGPARGEEGKHAGRPRKEILIDDKQPEGTEGNSPEEIRADIARTRAEMSETIDALQVKLNPKLLQERARETIRDATVGRVERTVGGTVDRAEGALQNAGETTREVSYNMMEMIRRNPVPSALTGLGIGWLLMNRAPSQRPYSPAYEEPRATYRGRTEIHPSEEEHEPGETPERLKEVSGKARARARGTMRTAGEAERNVTDVIRDNPVPTALMGLGLGWLLLNASSPRQVSYRSQQIRHRAEGMAEQTRHMVDETAGQASDVAESMVDQAQDTADFLAHETQHQAERLADSAGSVAEIVRENPVPAALVGLGLGWMYMNASARRESRAARRKGARKAARRSYIEEVRSRAGFVGAQAGEMVEQAGDLVGETAENVADMAQDTVGFIAHETQVQAGRVEDRFSDLMRTNPMAVGLGALALGALIGNALPETEQEQELMGDTRDNLMRRVQSSARQTGRKVERVAKETRSTAEKKSREEGLTS